MSTKNKKKLVTDFLKQQVFPTLEAGGFVREDPRKTILWRQSEFTADVVEFYIVPPGRSAEWGIPAYSFLVSAGVYYKFMPSFYDDELQREGDSVFPDEASCHFRLDLERSMPQSSCNVPNAWCINDDEENLDVIARHLNAQLERDVLPWFGQFRDIDKIYTDLLHSRADDDFCQEFIDRYRLSGGISIEIPGLLAHQVGDRKRAPVLLDETLAADLFEEDYERIQYMKHELERIRSEYN